MREQAERRLAVDEDEVVVLEHRAQQPGQRHLPGDLGDQLDLGRGQVDVGRQQVQPGHVGLDQDVLDRDVVLHEQVVDRQVEVVRVDAEADRERALRVEVDQQHLAPVLGQRRTEVDGGRGLADATLLVGHRDDAGRAVLVQRHRGSGSADASCTPSGPPARAPRPGQARTARPATSRPALGLLVDAAISLSPSSNQSASDRPRRVAVPPASHGPRAAPTLRHASPARGRRTGVLTSICAARSRPSDSDRGCAPHHSAAPGVGRDDGQPRARG